MEIFVGVSYDNKQIIKIWNLLFDTYITIEYLYLLVWINLVVFVAQNKCPKKLWKIYGTLYVWLVVSRNFCGIYW